MSRTWPIAVIVAVSLAATVVVRGAPQNEAAPSFKSVSSELVVLPVIVSDKNGRFVSDLPQDRFSVFDNGRPQPVSLFTNEDVPVTVGIVMDISGSMGSKLPYVEAATIAFARWSNPDDELFTIAFNDTVHHLLPGEAILAGDIPRLQDALMHLMPEGRTALYDALIAALDRLDAASRARKVLVLISDGGDNVSDASLRDVLARAQQSNAAIYTIGVFDPIDPDRNPNVLKQLARASGGERFLPPSPGPMLQACDRIAHEIRNQYTIAFEPPEHDGTYHKVRVQVRAAPNSPHLTVRTRHGYFAAGSNQGR